MLNTYAESSFPRLLHFCAAMCRDMRCYLIDSADVIGVRETRRFEGELSANEQDIAQARTFEDWVVTKSNFFFDLHNVEAPDWCQW